MYHCYSINYGKTLIQFSNNFSASMIDTHLIKLKEIRFVREVMQNLCVVIIYGKLRA